jgi:type VI secretion system protein ImpL
MKRWIVLIFSIIGVLILCALIWFVLPVIAIAGIEPFLNGWLRLAMIVLLLATYFGILAYKIYRYRKSSYELSQSLTSHEAEDDNSDAIVLAEKMQDALLMLKGSNKSKGDYLYELPWYLIVGPPGAGKTTALMNCGLKFPLATHGSGPIAGLGGTRYCDWWFTEDAVFIDTAGRYTTQDSDAESDRKSWLSFLDLLKKNRPRQPINGALIAISIGDILSLKKIEVASHAVAIRKRLSELNNHLQVDFPVYVVFTKSDLISGFMEFFGHLDDQKRKAVWGATFQTSNKKENRVGEVGTEIDLLISRLTAELSDRLQEEPDPVARVKLVGLPSQMVALKPAITQFLNQIFEPTRYQTSAALRGFYFTSGTQEGTPIDRVLGNISRNLGLQGGATTAYSGRTRSYFLEHLLTKVVFGEAGWVSTNTRAVRRNFLMRTASYGLVGLISLASLVGWLTSYNSNASLINTTQRASTNYASDYTSIINQDPVGDTDFLKIVDPLNTLRVYPIGYENGAGNPPLSSTFGLGQHRRIEVATTATYRTGLDRLLLPRLILHLEKRLTELQDAPEQLYEPLKAYMMLGGDPNIPLDTALISGWMQGDWEKLYPSEPNKIARDSLKQHLDAMLDLNSGVAPRMELNGDLVRATQTSLARLSLAERAFALIKSTARNPEIKDWTVAEHAGPDAQLVFATNNGAPLESVGVQALYTYDGFYGLFLNKLKAVITLLKNERWVLGEAGGTEVLDKQFTSLGPDLFRLYDQEFIKTWSAALAKLKLNSFSADRPEYSALRAVTGATSPLKLLLESIASETKLTEAKKTPDSTIGKELSDAADKLKAGLENQIGSIKEIGLDAAKKSDGRQGEVGTVFVPGALIQERFRRYHELTTANGSEKKQVDLMIEQLKGLYQSLLDEQNFERAVEARQNQQKFLSSLSTGSSRLEAPFSTMFKTTLAEFEEKIVGERVADLRGQLNSSVTRKCHDSVSNKYPFSPKSKRDVPLAEFARLFGPNGVFDSFYNEKLAGLVDTSGTEWDWKKNSKFSQELSQASLHQFQIAARIKDAFFTGQGTSPNVKFALVMQSLSQQSPSVTFEVNGTKLESPFGVESRGDFEWPGSSPDGTASVSMPEGNGSTAAVKFTGPWALYRLFKEGALRQSGNKAVVRFVIGGREVTYQLTFDTLDNPFTIISQSGFTCPSDL